MNPVRTQEEQKLVDAIRDSLKMFANPQMVGPTALRHAEYLVEKARECYAEELKSMAKERDDATEAIFRLQQEKEFRDWWTEMRDCKNELIAVKEMLRYVAYLRLLAGDTVFDHLDFERQKTIHDMIK